MSNFSKCDISSVNKTTPSPPSCKLSDPSQLYVDASARQPVFEDGNTILRYTSNCCCVAFWYGTSADNDDIMSTRQQTFGCLVCFYGLAILYLLFELRGTYKSKRHKSLGEFIKSRQLFMSFVSIFSMIAGIVACWLHYSTWTCMGGEGEGCVNGPSKTTHERLAAWHPMDSISNIGFIASKILVLQKCLRIVQMGLDKSPEAPSDRLLSVVVGLLCGSFVGCIGCAFVAYHSAQTRAGGIGQLRENPNSSATLSPFPFAIAAHFSSTAVMFALATLSSLLYVWHTTFHLSRYLKSLQKDTKVRRLSEDEEPTDTAALSAFDRIKNFAMTSPIQKTVKTLSGNLRRLQLSVALIALSFLCKALLYVTLAVGYSAGDPPYNSTITYPSYIDRHLCFPSYSNELRIVARTVWGSPLVVPLFTLFCDPFLTMYAAISFPTHHHPHRLNLSTN
jgi:hypothetical protein